jgi:uncharacterized protein (UPF0548 family)
VLFGAEIELIPHGGAVADGETVLLLIRAAALWTVAPSRVVYVVEEPGSFRFAYGTLPGHPEQGEASFAVTRNGRDDVFFRVASFSRPEPAMTEGGCGLRPMSSVTP